MVGHDRGDLLFAQDLAPLPHLAGAEESGVGAALHEPVLILLGLEHLEGRELDRPCADYAAERLYRDVRVDRIWEGTSEIMRAIIVNGVMKRDLARLLG